MFLTRDILSLKIVGAVITAATIVSITGCSGTDRPSEPEAPVIPNPTPNQQEEEWAISFAPLADYGGASRASTYPSLTEVYDNFAVYAYKTMADASKQDVLRTAEMLPYEVRFEPYPNATSTKKWHYDNIGPQFEHYWDFSARKYRFEAVAPYSFDGVSITEAPYNTKITDGRIQIKSVTGNVVPSAVPNWYVASHERDYSAAPAVTDTDLRGKADDPQLPQPQDLSDPVQLRFHHIMAEIELRVYNVEGSVISITSTSIEMRKRNPDKVPGASEDPLHPKPDYIDETLYTQGDFTSNCELSAWGEWSYISSSLTTPVYTMPASESVLITGSTKETANKLVTLAEVPQDVKNKYFHIEMATTSRTFSGTFPLLGTGDTGWLPGMKYIYYLCISDNEEIILFDIEIDKFKWKHGNEIGEDENEDFNNW